MIKLNKLRTLARNNLRSSVYFSYLLEIHSVFSVFSWFKLFHFFSVLVMSWWDIVTSGHVATWDIGDGSQTLRARVDAVLTCVDIDARAGGPEKCDTGDTHRYGICRL